MAARKTFIIDIDKNERVCVSRIVGKRPIVLEIHRLMPDYAVSFAELTDEMAKDIRDALDEVLRA